MGVVISSHSGRSYNKRARVRNHMDAHIGSYLRACIRKHKVVRNGSYRVQRSDNGRGARNGSYRVQRTDNGTGARTGKPRTDSGRVRVAVVIESSVPITVVA
jgi:hypothetical protein